MVYLKDEPHASNLNQAIRAQNGALTELNRVVVDREATSSKVFQIKHSVLLEFDVGLPARDFISPTFLCKINVHNIILSTSA